MNIGDPCYRLDGVAYLKLPYRIRLPDGTTRTDPDQYGTDLEVLGVTGWQLSTLTQDDIDRLTPAPPPPTPLEAGYETAGGWRLGWQADDVALLTGLYVLGQRAEELGVVQPIVVTDTDGVGHSMTFAEFDGLMLGYGAARAAISSNLAMPSNVAM